MSKTSNEIAQSKDAEPEEQPQHAPVCNVNHESGHRSAFSLNSMQDHSIITHRGDIDPHAEKRLLRKCDLRIIPITFWLYLLQHLDRTNVGNAKILGFEKDIGLRNGQFGALVSVFTAALILFCVPGNLIMRQTHPGRYLGGVAVLWGAMTVSTGFVHTYRQALAVRFVCGMTESLFWPAMLYYVMHWYKRYELQRRYVLLLCGSILSGAFGGLLAYALAKLDGRGGLAGWRWIFVVEGLLTSVSGIIAMFFIPDWPEKGSFLGYNEKLLLSMRLARDVQTVTMDRLDRRALKLVMSDWKIYTALLMHICGGAAGYSLTYFAPTILHDLGYSAEGAQVMSIPIYIVSAIFTLAIAQFSDRLQHRFGFLLLGASLGIIGFAILLAPGLGFIVKYTALYFAAIGFYVQISMVIVWTNNNFAGHYKRAIASGIATGMGNSAGFISSNIYPSSDEPRFIKGFSINLSLTVLLAVLSLLYFIFLKIGNNQRVAGKKDSRLSRTDADNLGDAHPDFKYTF